MLDVHAPHEKMHGFGDFLLHLLTITVGLLIAVGIEGCVEWRHHRHLAADARETMRAEIEHNAKTLDKALIEIKQGTGCDARQLRRHDKNSAQ